MWLFVCIESDAIALEELEQSERSEGGVSRFGIGARVHLCRHSRPIVSLNVSARSAPTVDEKLLELAKFGLPRKFELRVCRVEGRAGRESNANASASGPQPANTWIRDPQPLSQSTLDHSCSTCTSLSDYYTTDCTVHLYSYMYVQ